MLLLCRTDIEHCTLEFTLDPTWDIPLYSQLRGLVIPEKKN